MSKVALSLALLSCASTAETGPSLWLAWGDSYTIGESVAPEERWPAQLARLERDVTWRIEYTARTGWTTGDLLRALEARDYPSRLAARVSLLIGVNNQYRGRDPQEFQQEFEKLLLEAIRVSRSGPQGVLVLTIPDYGVTPFGRRLPGRTDNLAAFNRIIAETTRRLGAVLVDITPISLRAAIDSALTAPDGLHPSGAQYQLWAEEVFRAMEAVASERKHASVD